MPDPFEHLNALRLRLLHERARIRQIEGAKMDKRIKARTLLQRGMWVAQCEREIEGEIAFLAARGIFESALPEMTDAELLAELAE